MSGTLDIRSKKKGRLGARKIDEFIEELVDEIEKKDIILYWRSVIDRSREREPLTLRS